MDVRGDRWVNLLGASGEVEVTQVVGASGQETLLRPFRVTYSANGVGAVPESKSVSGLLKTYLEDAVSITVADIPFPYYEVIVYCSTADSNAVDVSTGSEDAALGVMHFSPLTINGVRYAWNASDTTQGAAGTPFADAHPSQVFGDASKGEPTLGANAFSFPISGSITDDAFNNKWVTATNAFSKKQTAAFSGDLTIRGGARATVTQDGKTVVVGQGGIAAIQIREVMPSVINVNMVGNENKSPYAEVGRIQGIGGFSGLFPITNARWNDLVGTSLSDLYASAGSPPTDARVETDIPAGTQGNYQHSADNGYPSAITDRRAKYGAMGLCYREAVAGSELRLRDMPYARYDLILYLGTDRDGKTWNPAKVTTADGEVTYYSYPAGTTALAAVASTSEPGAWGSSTDGLTPARMGLGRDVMLIRGLAGDVDIDTGAWVSTSNTRGGICGFQVVYAGEGRKAGSINLNFSGEGGDSAAVPVDDCFLKGGIEGADITVKNIPYEMYDVIVYMASSEAGKMAPVKVNGTYYSWQEQVPVVTTTPSHACDLGWGTGAQASAAIGTNAIRVKAQTDETLTVCTTGGLPELGDCVAAIQIVERLRVPVTGSASWANTIAGLDPSSPLYLDFGPTGQITGDVTLSDDDMVDLVDFKMVNVQYQTPPFAGTVTVNNSVEFCLPANTSFVKLVPEWSEVAGTSLCLASANGVYTSRGLMVWIPTEGSALWNIPIHWTGAANDNNWNNGANWSTGAVPASGASVLINLEENENLTIDVPAGTSVANVTVTGRGDGSTLTGNLTVTGAFTAQGKVDITQQNGTVSTPALNLDGAIYRIGAGATLAGTSGGTAVTETNSGKLIGAGGALNIKGLTSNTIDGDFTLVGASGYTGTLTVTGNVTLAASARPIPTLVKGEGATLTVYPASGETSLTIPGGFTKDDVTVVGPVQSDISASTSEEGLSLSWTTLPGTINFNFSANGQNVPTTDEYGLIPVHGSQWVNCSDADNDVFHDDGSVTASPNFPATGFPGTAPFIIFGSMSYGTFTSATDPLLKGYIGASDGNAYLRVEQVPYERYDAILYASTSDAAGVFGPYLMGNGTYTWKDDKPVLDADEGTSFGKGAQGTITLGVNAIRVNKLSNAPGDAKKSFSAGNKLTVTSTHRYGAIAAEQVIRRVVLTVDKPMSWDVLASGLVADAPVDIEFGPNGQITGDVTLPTDSTVDLTGFDFSQGNRPFAGNLTINDKETLSAGGTIILLPTEAEQYLPANGDLTAPLAGGTVTTTTTPNLSRGGRGCACWTSYAGAGNNPGAFGWAGTRAPFVRGSTRRSSGGSAGRAATVSSTAPPDTGSRNCATTRRRTFWAGRAGGSRARFTQATGCRWCSGSARTSKASCRARPTKPSSPACGWPRATGA